MRAEMEEAEQWAADLMDDQTGTSKKVQAAETMRMIPSDVCCEILDLNEGENLTGLCKRKKMIKTTFSPRVSEEIAAVEPEDAAEFMNAASQGKLSLIEKYLADGGNPNAHDELNRTALHRASLQGHTAVVQMLLERGADINFKDQSALLIGRGRAAVFQLGSRALHWACRGDSLGVVKALKSHGADLNVRDKLYSTPLHVATRTGHTAIVEYLMSCGAKINSRDREGDTALHDAVRLNRYKIVKLLIVAGADTKITNHEGLTAVQQVKQWQFDIMETLQRLDKLRDVDLPENPARAE